MTETQARLVWHEFVRSRSSEIKRRLVLQYLDLVCYVVSRFGLHGYGRCHGLERDDMVQFGVLGLVHAIDRFSPVMEVKFETFAVPRIRGAILDELRKLDWVPRSVRANRRKRELAAVQISRETGREPSAQEIAHRLALTLEDYGRLVNDSGGAARVREQRQESALASHETLENLAEQSPDPYEQLRNAETKALLVEVIEQLPERERSVIVLYYYEGLKFLEIAKILRVSESRVSQIHSEVLGRLRTRLVGVR